MMILYKRDSLIYFEQGNEKFFVNQQNIDISISPTGSEIADITLRRINGLKKVTIEASEIVGFKGDAYGNTVDDVVFGVFHGQDVNNQDQTTDDIIARFNKVSHGTTLASSGSINDKTITLTDPTGAAAGKYIILFHPESERFTPFFQVGAAAGSVITLDSRLDFDYPAGTFVDLADTNMAVDGSSTAQTFGLRGIGAPPGVDIEFDMTRIVISCLCEQAVDLSKFADLDALTHGMEFRMRDGRYHNSFNVKSNRQIDAIFGTDWKAYQAINPVQGQDGFTARVTFAGMDKIGVSKRMRLGEDYEVTVQDDLLSVQSGDRQITLLEVFAEGHITEQP